MKGLHSRSTGGRVSLFLQGFYRPLSSVAKQNDLEQTVNNEVFNKSCAGGLPTSGLSFHCSSTELFSQDSTRRRVQCLFKSARVHCCLRLLPQSIHILFQCIFYPKRWVRVACPPAQPVLEWRKARLCCCFTWLDIVPVESISGDQRMWPVCQIITLPTPQIRNGLNMFGSVWEGKSQLGSGDGHRCFIPVKMNVDDDVCCLYSI